VWADVKPMIASGAELAEDKAEELKAVMIELMAKAGPIVSANLGKAFAAASAAGMPVFTAMSEMADVGLVAASAALAEIDMSGVKSLVDTYGGAAAEATGDFAEVAGNRFSSLITSSSLITASLLFSS